LADAIVLIADTYYRPIIGASLEWSLDFLSSSAVGHTVHNCLAKCVPSQNFMNFYAQLFDQDFLQNTEMLTNKFELLYDLVAPLRLSQSNLI